VAKSSQGIYVAMDDAGPAGDVNITELVSVSIDGIQCDTVEVTPRSQTTRNKSFSPADTDYGTVSIVMRSQSFITEAAVGEPCSLTIADASVTYWGGPAIIQSLAWRASVGELQEYSVTLKLGSRTST
jgi:type III secretory pathway lipoprotein EscJ